MTDYAIGRLVDHCRRIISAAIREGIKRRPGWKARKEGLEEKAMRIKFRLRIEGIVLKETGTGTTWTRISTSGAIQIPIEVE